MERYVTLDWPLRGHAVTQYFGENPDVYKRITVAGVRLRGHNGLDLHANFEPVFAPMDGVIAEAEDEGAVPGYGKYVKIVDASARGSTPGELRATCKYHVVLAHLSRIDVKVGQRVHKNQQIGVSGNTGWSTGPHLHMGLRIKPYRRNDGWGGYVNPLPHLLHTDTLTLPPVGPYWEPKHRGQNDDRIMRDWKPAVIKLERNGWDNPNFIATLYQDLYKTFFVWRDYELTKEALHGDMLADPEALAERTAQAYIDAWNKLNKDVRLDKSRTAFMAINEPPIWLPGYKEAANAFNARFAWRLTREGFQAVLGNINVGWPDNHCNGCPPDWTWFAETLHAARVGGHIISDHEYFSTDGPLAWDKWWFRRGEAIPEPQARRLVGELGFNKAIENPSIDLEHAGWRSHVSEDEYMRQLNEAQTAGRDSRLIGATIFLYDYNNSQWKSFAVGPDAIANKLPELQGPRVISDDLHFHDDVGQVQPPQPTACEDALATLKQRIAAIAQELQTLSRG